MKKLGVIGGMGPSATALFYEMIIENTPASNDQEHIPMIIINDSQMPDRTKAILGSDSDKNQVYIRLLKDALYLKQGGCDSIAIPCNTSHYFADRLEKETGLKLFNMLRLTAKEAKEKCSGGGTVAVLATDGTIKTGIYQNALEEVGLNTWIPSDDVQAMVMSVIYDYVKAGKKVPKDIWQGIEDAFKKAGSGFAILGCTELSIVRKELNLGETYIDAMLALAKGCIRDYR